MYSVPAPNFLFAFSIIRGLNTPSNPDPLLWQLRVLRGLPIRPRTVHGAYLLLQTHRSALVLYSSRLRRYIGTLRQFTVQNLWRYNPRVPKEPCCDKYQIHIQYIFASRQSHSSSCGLSSRPFPSASFTHFNLFENTLVIFDKLFNRRLIDSRIFSKHSDCFLLTVIGL